MALSRVPDTRITVADDACRLTESSIAGGPAVLSIGSRGAAAIGTLEPGRTDAEIEAFLASNPSGPPPRFPTVALLQAADGISATAYADLEPGELTVVCIDAVGDQAVLVGRATLTVTEPG